MATAEAPTLTALLKVAAVAFPSRRAVAVPGGLELTHAALNAIVDDAAARLAAGAGIIPGHVVALAFPTNTVELVIMFLAVVRARAVAVPLDPAALTQEELEFYLSDSQARLLITSADGNAAAQAAAAAKLGLAHVAASLPNPAGPVHLAGIPADSTAGNGNGSKYPGFTADNDPSDVALLVYTTSRREVMPLTQRDLAASVQSVRSAYGLVDTDATVAVVPLLHVHGLICVLLGSLASGASVSLPAVAGRFSAAESLATETLEKMEAAFGAPVPEAAHLMTPNPLPQDYKYAKSFSVEKKTTGGPAGESAPMQSTAERPPHYLRDRMPLYYRCSITKAHTQWRVSSATAEDLNRRPKAPVRSMEASLNSCATDYLSWAFVLLPWR